MKSKVILVKPAEEQNRVNIDKKQSRLQKCLVFTVPKKFRALEFTNLSAIHSVDREQYANEITMPISC